MQNGAGRPVAMTEEAASVRAKRGALAAGEWRDLRLALRLAQRAQCAAVQVRHVTMHLHARPAAAAAARPGPPGAHQARGRGRRARPRAHGGTLHAAKRGGCVEQQQQQQPQPQQSAPAI